MYYQYMVLDGKCVEGMGLKERGRIGGQEHLGFRPFHSNPLSTLPEVTSLSMIVRLFVAFSGE